MIIPIEAIADEIRKSLDRDGLVICKRDLLERVADDCEYLREMVPEFKERLADMEKTLRTVARAGKQS